MNDTKMTAENPSNPKQVREKTGLNEDEMAGLMGMSLRGYRNWEAGYRSPGGPAQRLLALIEADPKEMQARIGAIA